MRTTLPWFMNYRKRSAVLNRIAKRFGLDQRTECRQAIDKAVAMLGYKVNNYKKEAANLGTVNCHILHNNDSSSFFAINQ